MAKASETLAFQLARPYVLVTRYFKDGKLDHSFGENGVASGEFPLRDRAELLDVAFRRNDGIVACGYGAVGSNYRHILVGYSLAGAIDRTFGDFGIAELPALHHYAPNLLAVRPTGEILVASTELRGALPVSQFTKDGKIDAGFGDAGTAIFKVETDKMRCPSFESMTLDQHGAVSLAGRVLENVAVNGTSPKWEVKYAIGRLTSDGKPDASFGAHGLATNARLREGSAHSVVVGQDGSVLSIGHEGDDWLQGNLVVSKMRPDGTLAAGFGGDGVVREEMVSYGRRKSISVYEDGRMIVQAVQPLGAGHSEFLMLRYRADGTRDNSFGREGLVQYNPALFQSGLMLRDPSGSLWTYGSVNFRPNRYRHIFIARFTDTGQLDNGFGRGGEVVSDFYANAATLDDVAIDSDYIMVCGAFEG